MPFNKLLPYTTQFSGDSNKIRNLENVETMSTNTVVGREAGRNNRNANSYSVLIGYQAGAMSKNPDQNVFIDIKADTIQMEIQIIYFLAHNQD